MTPFIESKNNNMELEVSVMDPLWYILFASIRVPY